MITRQAVRRILGFVGMLAAGGLVWGTSLAWGQSENGENSSGERVLHEYLDEGPVPEETAGESSRAGSRGGRSNRGGSGGEVPSRRSTGARESPGLTVNARGGEVILGPEGPAEQEIERSPYGELGQGTSATKLDSKTDRVGELSYHSSFQPSVFPYKRMVSQNQPVKRGGQNYGLATRRGELQRVPVGGIERSREDTFWGSFLIRAEADKLHSIPSVAPHQRVLRLESEPQVDWAVLKDEAGNFYVRGDHRGVVRVNMKVSVPVFYFSGEFQAFDGGWEAFPEVRGLAGGISDVAQRVLGEVGVSRQQPPVRVMRDLVYHFRNFETKALPEKLKQGDLYYNIASSQIGVCRHRSLAFVITARQLGIPARYIFNEAHAFVEVYWPGDGWRRIDLGGAARDIGYQGGSNDSVHARSADDPLPKPPAYRRELERLERMQDRSGRQGDVSITRDAGPGAVEEGATEGGGSEPGGRTQPEGNVSESARDDGRVRGESGRAGAEDGRGSGERRESMEFDEMMEGLSQGGEGEDRLSTALTLSVEGREVYRGESVTVRGRLTAEGRPVADKKVGIYFGASGSDGQMRQIGSATTDAQGRYEASVQIPKRTEIGRWQLVARFGGTSQLAEAVGK